MQIIADISKISKTIQRNLFLKMFFENLAFILPSFQQFLLKRILVFSYKIVFIENETALLCVTVRERTRASTYSSKQVQKFLIYLLLLKSSIFVVHFSNAFWHGNGVFPKGSSQNEIAALLVIFNLPCSKYRGVKICFYSCSYQNQNFSLVLHLCRSCSTLSHSCHSCSTRVTLASRSCFLCLTRVTRVWRSCCKLG